LYLLSRRQRQHKNGGGNPAVCAPTKIIIRGKVITIRGNLNIQDNTFFTTMPTAELVEVDAANANNDRNGIILDATRDVTEVNKPPVEVWNISIKTVGGRRGILQKQKTSVNNNNMMASSSSQVGLPKSEYDNEENTPADDSNNGSSIAGGDGRNDNNCAANNEFSSNFVVQISPSDPLSILNDRITEITGLTKDEQRLIYRGRIIDTGIGKSCDNTRDKSHAENKQQRQRTVGDIVGLANGQTIHLVPRIIPTVDNEIITPTVAAHDSESNRFAAATTTTNAGGGGSTSTTLSGEAGLALLAALLGMNNNTNNINTSGPGNIQLPQQLQPLPGVGIVRGTRMTTSAITPPSARARATTGGVDGTGLGGIIHRASNMGVINVPSATASDTATTTDNDTNAAMTGRELLLFPQLPNGVNDNSNNDNDGGTNAESREFASMLDSRLAAAAIPPGDRTAAAAAARYVSNQARLIASRLTEADLRNVPDPGGLEHVRQGMMTLHTMLGGSDGVVVDVDGDTATSSRRLTAHHVDGAIASTPVVRRRWYRGQWLDALDTVHQWLEATVVDVVLPSDVLTDTDLIDDAGEDNNIDGTTPRRENSTTNRRSPPDAVVSANDLDGRRRLLFEPVTHHTNENQDAIPQGYDDDGDSGHRYRPRQNNDDVQLLLIHYNGWPHRWDEWIRSDSERIRPFRTRTRHRVASAAGGASSLPPSTYHYNNGITNTNLACPTPHAAFGASPSTAIRDEDDVPWERCAMLVELARITQVVNGLLQATALAAATNASTSSSNDGSNSDFAYTTWTGRRSDSLHLPWLNYSPPSPQGSSYTSESISPFLDNARLRQLAPLLDRLGRTLTDAAPHIAALADALPLAMPVVPQPIDIYGSAAIAGEEDIIANEAITTRALSEDEVHNLTARASHLYFGMGDSNAHNETPTATAVPDSQSNSSPLADVLGLLPNNAEGTFTVDGASPTDDILPELITMPSIVPDLTDYVNGMVNTTRGDVSLGRNSHRDNSMDSLGPSLLTSYLASMAGNTSDGNSGDTNGARTILMGGGGGFGSNTGLGSLGGGGGGVSGIDIHIHAIVTNAGMGGVGDGFNTAGVLGPFSPVTTPRNNARSSAVSGNMTPQNHRHDDDADLFSELYSESPYPVNFHGEENTRVNNQSGNDVECLFEECQSIDEEDSSDYKFSEDENEEDRPAIKSKLEENPIILVDSDIDDHIDASLESLSGNESNECTTSPPQSLTSTEEAIVLTHIGSNDRSRNNTSNPRSSYSLGRRLFRRAFGRMSGSSRRSD